MEELHRIHKDVPFGYWIDYVAPAWRALVRRLHARKADTATWTRTVGPSFPPRTTL